MALVITNCFDVLASDEELEATTPLPNAGKSKKQQQQQQAAAAKKKQETKSDAATAITRAKPKPKPMLVLGHEKFTRRETKIRTLPKESQHNYNINYEYEDAAMQIERNLSTLKEYEKKLLEKKRDLNLNNAGHEERKVSLDKDFESMKLISKKKEDDDGVFSIKPTRSDMKAKVHNNKLVDIGGFFEPVARSRPRSFVVVNGHGEAGTSTIKADANITNINFVDHTQFPSLKLKRDATRAKDFV